MTNDFKETFEDPRRPVTSSPVRAVVSWLVAATREFGAAQSMVNDTDQKN